MRCVRSIGLGCGVVLAAALFGQLGCGSQQEGAQPQAAQPARAKSSALNIKLDAAGPEIRANVGRLEAMATPPTVTLGRAFDAEEHRVGNSRVILVTQKFWSEHLESKPEAIGRQIEIGGQPRQIIGVLAPDADVNPEVDVWMPRSMEQ